MSTCSEVQYVSVLTSEYHLFSLQIENSSVQRHGSGLRTMKSVRFETSWAIEYIHQHISSFDSGCRTDWISQSHSERREASSVSSTLLVGARRPYNHPRYGRCCRRAGLVSSIAELRHFDRSTLKTIQMALVASSVQMMAVDV